MSFPPVDRTLLSIVATSMEVMAAVGDKLVEKLVALRGAGESQIEKEIMTLLTYGQSASSVQAARDHLPSLLAEVQDGHMRLVGHEGSEIVVLLSIKDLATLIACPAEPLSFGSALDEVGFEPLGRRIRIAPEGRSSRPKVSQRPA